MKMHTDIGGDDLRRSIRQKEICFAGNLKLKIYGRLNCSSGKRMRKDNRVFFNSEQEAIQMGFRPCGNCMKASYRSYIAK